MLVRELLRSLTVVLIALLFATALQAQESQSFRDTVFTDQQGRPFTLREMEGGLTLLNFIFTRCPGACPTQVSKLVKVQKQLMAAHITNVEFVSLSIDPEFDTPEKLKEFAQKQSVNFSNWRLGRAEPATTRKLTDTFAAGLTKDGIGSLDHKMAVYLLDPSGGILQVYAGANLDVARIVRELTQVAPKYLSQ